MSAEETPNSSILNQAYTLPMNKKAQNNSYFLGSN